MALPVFLLFLAKYVRNSAKINHHFEVSQERGILVESVIHWSQRQRHRFRSCPTIYLRHLPASLVAAWQAHSVCMICAWDTGYQTGSHGLQEWKQLYHGESAIVHRIWRGHSEFNQVDYAILHSFPECPLSMPESSSSKERVEDLFNFVQFWCVDWLAHLF